MYFQYNCRTMDEIKNRILICFLLFYSITNCIPAQYAGHNWSFSANGTSANKIPNEGTRVVFEGSSGGDIKVNFPTNAKAFSLNLFGNQLG